LLKNQLLAVLMLPGTGLPQKLLIKVMVVPMQIWLGFNKFLQLILMRQVNHTQVLQLGQLDLSKKYL
jgi:hypothetical protein